MASTAVDICNLALFRVRAGEIGSLDEQSVNAEKCRVLYPHTVDKILTAYPWSFARTDRVLSRKDYEPVEWEYAFDYPNDCVQMRYLVPTSEDGSTVRGFRHNLYEEEPIRWEIALGPDGNKHILTDYEYAIGVYTKDIDTIKLWDALFSEMVAWALAIDLAIPLGGDSGKTYRTEATTAFYEAEAQAKAKHANERWPRARQAEPKSIRARGERIVSRDQLVYYRGWR